MGQRQKNTARRHHILPQLLLRRFAHNDKVWVLDKAENRSYRTNIINAACEKDYYGVETIDGEIGQDCVEQKALAPIEGKADPVIQNMLRSHKLPQGDDWVVMANFLAVMYTRGPRLRDLIKHIFQFGSEVIEEHIHSDEDIWRATFEEISKETDIDFNMDYEEALRARREMNIQIDIPTTYYVREALLLGAFFVPIFLEMMPNLEIVDVVCDAEYILSDCPIVPISKSPNPSPGWRWFRNRDADLFIPLSSRACLVLNYDKLPKVIRVGRKRVAFVNHLMVCNSLRTIISKQQDFVWSRENGTTSVSNKELFKFIEKLRYEPTENIYEEYVRNGIQNALGKIEKSK